MGITTTGLIEAATYVVDTPIRAARRAILDMSQIAYDRMQAGAGRHNRTGALFASVYTRALEPLTRQVGHDTQRAPHAAFVLHGTRPHVIRPNTKRALRWVHGNNFVFARFVNHPGYRGDDYLEPAAQAAAAALPQIIDRALKEI